jgi:CheY-like chemotaxis protein
MMPGMSGLSLVSRLRSAHNCKTPIIMMSTLDHKPLLDSAFKAGANDFLSKPVSFEALVEKLKQFDKHLSF